MGKIRYLQRAPNGIYRFRAYVPEPLRPYFGNRREVVQSLRTRDREEAKRRLRQAETAFKQRCKQARAELAKSRLPPRRVELDDVLSDQLIQLALHHILYNGLSFIDQRGALQPEGLERMVEGLREAYARGGDPDIEARFLRFFEKVLNITLDRQQAGYALFQRRMLYRVTTLVQNLARHVRDPFAEELPNIPLPEALLARYSGPGGRAIDDLYEAWVKQDPTRPPATLRAVRRVLDDLMAVTGKSYAAEIDRRDVRAFVEHLQEDIGNHPATITKKVHMIGAVFNNAVRQDLLPNSPFRHLALPRAKRARAKRKPFTVPLLQRIFSSSLYTAQRYDHRPAYRWLPLLALYQGARLEELAQLRVADVIDSGGICCLRIDVTDPTKQCLKNEASRRVLPLHQAILEAGFLSLVDERRRAGHDRLFPELAPGPDGRFGSRFSKAFSRLLRKELGINERCYVFHSFRHTFEDACRDAGLDFALTDALMGHAPNLGRNYRYGTGFSIDRLKKVNRPVYSGDCFV